jgi:hypothetical protein
MARPVHRSTALRQRLHDDGRRVEVHPCDEDLRDREHDRVEQLRGLVEAPAQGTVIAPYCTPLAAMPRISMAPEFADTNARPVTHAGKPRPARKNWS